MTMIPSDRGRIVGYCPDNNADKTICLDCWDKHQSSLAGVGFTLDEEKMMVEIFDSECEYYDGCYLCGGVLLDV